MITTPRRRSGERVRGTRPAVPVGVDRFEMARLVEASMHGPLDSFLAEPMSSAHRLQIRHQLDVLLGLEDRSGPELTFAT